MLGAELEWAVGRLLNDEALTACPDLSGNTTRN